MCFNAVVGGHSGSPIAALQSAPGLQFWFIFLGIRHFSLHSAQCWAQMLLAFSAYLMLKMEVLPLPLQESYMSITLGCSWHMCRLEKSLAKQCDVPFSDWFGAGHRYIGREIPTCQVKRGLI